jgi:hypothetical protein
MGLPAEDFDFVGSYNNQRISEIDSERSINCFEYRDPRGKKPKSLLGTSGLINTNTAFTGSPSGGFRGQFVFLGNQYLVIGTFAYLIEANGTVVLLSSAIDGPSAYVGIDGNEFQVIFVDGEFGYVYDTISGVFTKITDPSFPALPIDVCMLDEFAIVANGMTNNFQLSSFNQALIWGPDNSGVASTFTMASSSSHIVITYATGGSILNYQVGTPIVFSGGSLPAELTAGVTYYVKAIINPTTITVSATDGGTVITSVSGGNGSLTNNGVLQLGSITTHSGTIVACRTLHRRLFLFSQFYTEVWENAGIGTNLPFRRNNAALIEYGTPAIGSIAVSFDRMFFLAQSRDGIGPFMEVSGAQANQVSNRALNTQLAIWSTLGQVSDCRAFMIQENGVIFYRANFTAANHTFIYNASFSNPSTNSDEDLLWHEEETLEGNRHPTQTHAYFNGINYAGDYANPILYQVSAIAYSNNGENIPRTRIIRPIMNPGSCRRRVDRIFFDMVQGSISLDDVVSTPFVYLSISKDGGQSYGNMLRLPFGAVGQRTFRTIARKLGVIPRGQAFVCKLQFYAQVPFEILGASWVTEVLPE